MAETNKIKERALGHYRRVRDEIRAFVEKLPQFLSGLNTEKSQR